MANVWFTIAHSEVLFTKQNIIINFLKNERGLYMTENNTMEVKEELKKVDVSNLIEKIFDETYLSVKFKVDDDKEMLKEDYYTYLSNKYGELLEKVALEKSDEIINNTVELCVSRELLYLESIGRYWILASIFDIDDGAFQRLTYLVEQASNDAYRYHAYGVCMGEKEYKLRMKELTDCMSDISLYNSEKAKRLLLYAILDLNYAFKKSDLDAEGLEFIFQAH